MRASIHLGSDYVAFRKKMMEVSEQLAIEARSVSGPINQTLVWGANEIRNHIIKSMDKTPKKTDVSYKRTKSGKMHYPSLPGHPPAVDYGNLIGSIVYEATNLRVEVGSEQTDPPYGAYLEDGTDKVAARPWLKPAFEAWAPKIEDRLVKAFGAIIDRSK